MDIQQLVNPDKHPAQNLHTIVSALRSENGCPWDKKQTPDSLTKYLLDETRELIEAIQTGNTTHICEEIGDVYFILTLLTILHEERGNFTTENVWEGISKKMIRRHPHVFADQRVNSEEELRELWDKIKAGEKQKKG
jgi:uncharacterized protein YabN with tetrapyrrole methylase and pyrophosphatase domain